ncbi:MAG: DUF2807 domain-containing protein [Bacteroidetes bacterium]|nr:MAG: DUF2807 domain-containing protein [Bacteroidota bacterium]
MKPYLLCLCAGLWLFSSCGVGSGDLVVPVSNFNEITLYVPLQLELKQGNNFQVVLNGDSAWLSHIDVIVVGTTLQVTIPPGTNFPGSSDSTGLYGVLMEVTLPDLNALTVNGLAKVRTVNTFTLDDLDVTLNGAAKVSLDLDAEDLKVNNAGASSLEIEGDLQSVDLEIAGAARFSAEGTAVQQDISILGAGSVDAFEFVTQSCGVTFIGAGEAKVQASQSLTVSIVGAGMVYYKGQPNIDKTIIGAGAVVDAN